MPSAGQIKATQSSPAFDIEAYFANLEKIIEKEDIDSVRAIVITRAIDILDMNERRLVEWSKRKSAPYPFTTPLDLFTIATIRNRLSAMLTETRERVNARIADANRRPALTAAE